MFDPKKFIFYSCKQKSVNHFNKEATIENNQKMYLINQISKVPGFKISLSSNGKVRF